MEKPALNYKWYQFQKSITIEIYQKGIENQEISCTLVQSDLIEIQIKDNKYSFDLDGTAENPQISSNKYKIELIFQVTSIPSQLDYLLKIERPNEDTKLKKYAELDNLGKDDEVKDSMASMRDIYKQVDEKAQHAMMKSFYESGGTVLSTNYDEVFAGKVQGYYQQKAEDEKNKDK
ncbi:Sgt1-like protein [Spironucleus salmonicida]|uniref:Sgt1-like protein n=1 Tax=Spironucleus salmonicida TaxID=348837 RepID=V6LJR3_9EUKA|nr:Sgt1-like protein [Spironucleus salmonicida]|eukprot:EST44618.1 Sgt1-like protein [Spironucleus salmonicida]